MLTERHKKYLAERGAARPQLRSFKSDLKNEVALIEREYLSASTSLPPSKKSELLDAMFQFKSAHADLLGCSAERPVFQKSSSFNNRPSKDRNEDAVTRRTSRSFNLKQPLAPSVDSPRREAKDVKSPRCSHGLGMTSSDRERKNKSGPPPPPPPPPPRPPFKCGEEDALTHENLGHNDKPNDIVPPVDVSFSRETQKRNYRSRAQDYLDLQCYRMTHENGNVEMQQRRSSLQSSSGDGTNYMSGSPGKPGDRRSSACTEHTADLTEAQGDELDCSVVSALSDTTRGYVRPILNGKF